MQNDKIKVYLFLPYLRTLSPVVIGSTTFKNINDFGKETQEVQDELRRIASFFRQAEARELDAFSYIILEDTQENLNKTFKKIRKDLEIFRYLTLDPKGKGLSSEHSSIYVIFPDPKNPWTHEKKQHFMYRITENFIGKERFVTFPHASTRPPFAKEIYGESPPHIDEKLREKLNQTVIDSDLRAISWYNKTFSISAQDGKENLLRLSVAFESFFLLDEEEGREKILSKIADIIKSYIQEPNLSEKLKQIKPYVSSMIVGRLSEAMKAITNSETIKKWFKKNFYSVGSGIRHGDEVSELPNPVVSKNKLGMSLWYAGDASHEYLNNVYFGQRLFKFILEERYFPYEEHLKPLYIEQLDALLTSDEERLKKLESIVSSKPIGELIQEDISIATSFKGTFYGSKERILQILKRLLQELKSNPTIWTEIAANGELLLLANLKEEDFSDYEKTKTFYHSLIEVDSFLDDKASSKEWTEEDMKLFCIKQFINYALHRII